MAAKKAVASPTGKQLGKAQVRLMVRIQLQIEDVDLSRVTDRWIDALFERFDSDKSGTMDDEEWESLTEMLKDEAQQQRVATYSPNLFPALEEPEPEPERP